MIYFIYAIIVILSLSVITQVSCVAKDEYPVRNRKTVVWDAFFNIVFILWAIILIVKT